LAGTGALGFDGGLGAGVEFVIALDGVDGDGGRLRPGGEWWKGDGGGAVQEEEGEKNLHRGFQSEAGWSLAWLRLRIAQDDGGDCGVSWELTTAHNSWMPF
jgi:hypothetical protein